jgi:hypothetical protein
MGYRPLRICARRKSKEEEEGRKRPEKTNQRKGKGYGEVSERQEVYNRYIMAAAPPEETAKVWFYGKLPRAALCGTVVNKGRFFP